MATQLAVDEYISYDEAVVIDSLIKSESSYIDSLRNSQKERSRNARMADQRALTLKTMINRFKKCQFADFRGDFGYYSLMAYRMSADSILTWHEYDTLQKTRMNPSTGEVAVGKKMLAYWAEADIDWSVLKNYNESVAYLAARTSRIGRLDSLELDSIPQDSTYLEAVVDSLLALNGSKKLKLPKSVVKLPYNPNYSVPLSGADEQKWLGFIAAEAIVNINKTLDKKYKVYYLDSLYIDSLARFKATQLLFPIDYDPVTFEDLSTKKRMKSWDYQGDTFDIKSFGSMKDSLFIYDVATEDLYVVNLTLDQFLNSSFSDQVSGLNMIVADTTNKAYLATWQDYYNNDTKTWGLTGQDNTKGRLGLPDSVLLNNYVRAMLEERQKLGIVRLSKRVSGRFKSEINWGDRIKELGREFR